MIKKIGVLTSGGDSPGMNAAIRAVVKSGLSRGMEVWGIYDGYKGLLEGNMVKMDRPLVSDIILNGGTMLGSARLPEFKQDEVQYKGIEQLKKNGIEALVCIGGDGTYRGAKALTEKGINCIGVPGTIDNDIVSTDHTIGFDTALNTIVEAVDRIRDTSASHHRCSVVEVMGNHCGDLALYSGIASGADFIITPETGFNEDELIEKIKKLQLVEKKKHNIIIISEKLTDVEALAKHITANTTYEARASILGHIQRGGRPTATDRILATRMGDMAVTLLAEGKGGLCIGERQGEIVSYDILEALEMPRPDHSEYYQIQSRVKYYG